MKITSERTQEDHQRIARLRLSILSHGLVAIFSAALVGCASQPQSDVPPNVELPAAQIAQVAEVADLDARLNAAENRWKASGAKNYSYTIEMECQLCAPPVHVVVRKARCVKAKTAVVHWQAISCSGRTVPELFHTIRLLMAHQDASISASFDATYGYPTISFVQTNVPQDTEIYRITNFKVMR